MATSGLRTDRFATCLGVLVVLAISGQVIKLQPSLGKPILNHSVGRVQRRSFRKVGNRLL